MNDNSKEAQKARKSSGLMTVCVLTPTYNRRDQIMKLYDSLQRQTSKDFSWFIIDDGSEDGTEELVRRWIGSESEFKIEFYRKDNGGKHTALNYGFRHIKEPLTFIVDSDDMLTDDAIEKINKLYERIKDDENICGIAFLRGHGDGTCIGDRFRTEGRVNWNHMRYREEIQGDKAEVWRTECLKKYSFPVFENEKFMGENYIWCQLGERYDIYAVNEIIYLCDYLEGGLTKSGRRMRIHCPNGGMENSKVLLKKKYPLKYRIKNAILYDCYSFFAGKRLVRAVTESGYPLLASFHVLPAWILYRYWGHKYGK